MAKLKSCPCGETPKSLLIVDNGAKWAYATGDCCNEWHVEFRTGYNKIESSECMALAVEAWNLAARKPPNTGLQSDACPHCGDVGPKLWTGEYHICPMCRKRR